MRPIVPVIPLLLALPCLTAMNSFAASEGAECTALHAEVETLRAKVRTLEAALSPVSTAPPQAAALPGTAAKPAATATLVIEEPYSRSGCSRGLFKGIDPAQWQEGDRWLDLEKGQSPAEVEKLLGVEHYDERGGSNVIWHYGKCGASSRAQVLFTNGKLADWRAPSR